jgi:hypothetical protein
LRGSILIRPLDHFIRYCKSEGTTGHNVAAVVNASPNSGFGGTLGEFRERFGISREEIAEHLGNCDR